MQGRGEIRKNGKGKITNRRDEREGRTLTERSEVSK